MVLERSAVAQISFWRHGAERLEFVDEVSLVEIAAVDRDAGPVRFSVGIREHAQERLKTLHATVKLRRKADRAFEHFNEAGLAIAGGLRHVADLARVSGAMEFGDCIGDGRRGGVVAGKSAGKSDFDGVEPGGDGRRGLNAMTYFSRGFAPEVVEGDVAIV